MFKVTPVLGLLGGSVFVVNSGILNGRFYSVGLPLFTTSLVMAWMERNGIEYSITVFGLVSVAAYLLSWLEILSPGGEGEAKLSGA